MHGKKEDFTFERLFKLISSHLRIIGDKKNQSPTFVLEGTTRKKQMFRFYLRHYQVQKGTLKGYERTEFH